jgi:hypothetical protein
MAAIVPNLPDYDRICGDTRRVSGDALRNLDVVFLANGGGFVLEYVTECDNLNKSRRQPNAVPRGSTHPV